MLLQPSEPSLFERDIVVIVQIIYAEYTVAACEKCFADVISNKSGGAGNEYCHHFSVETRADANDMSGARIVSVSRHAL